MAIAPLGLLAPAPVVQASAIPGAMASLGLLWIISRWAAPSPAPLNLQRTFWPWLLLAVIAAAYLLPIIPPAYTRDHGLLRQQPLVDALEPWGAAPLPLSWASTHAQATLSRLGLIFAGLVTALITRDRWRALPARQLPTLALCLGPLVAGLAQALMENKGLVWASLAPLFAAAGMVALGLGLGRASPSERDDDSDPQRPLWVLIGLLAVVSGGWLLSKGPAQIAWVTLAGGGLVLALGAATRRVELSAATGVGLVGLMGVGGLLGMMLSPPGGSWGDAQRMGPGVSAWMAPEGAIANGVHALLVDGGPEWAALVLTGMLAVGLQILSQRPWRQGQAGLSLGLIAALTSLGLWSLATSAPWTGALAVWAAVACGLLMGPGERRFVEPALVWGHPPAASWGLGPGLAATACLTVAPIAGEAFNLQGQGLVQHGWGAHLAGLEALGVAHRLRPLDGRPHGWAAIAAVVEATEQEGPLTDDQIVGAREHITAALKRAPMSGLGQIALAGIAWEQGRPVEARRWALISALMPPSREVAWTTWPIVFSADVATQDLPALRDDLARAIAHDPDAVLIRTAEAAWAIGDGDITELLSPGLPWIAQLDILQRAAANGHEREALLPLVKGLAEDRPSGRAPVSKLITLALDVGANELALSLSQEALRAHPDDRQLALRTAEALLAAGETGEAAELMQTLKEGASFGAAERKLYARILAEGGDLEGALKALNALIELRPDDESTLRLGVVLARGGSSAQRIAALERLLAVAEDDVDALVELATIYEERGPQLYAARLWQRCKKVAGDASRCEAAPGSAPASPAPSP